MQFVQSRFASKLCTGSQEVVPPCPASRRAHSRNHIYSRGTHLRGFPHRPPRICRAETETFLRLFRQRCADVCDARPLATTRQVCQEAGKVAGRITGSPGGFGFGFCQSFFARVFFTWFLASLLLYSYTFLLFLFDFGTCLPIISFTAGSFQDGSFHSSWRTFYIHLSSSLFASRRGGAAFGLLLVSATVSPHLRSRSYITRACVYSCKII